MNDRVREILSWYANENPGVRTNLARMLNHGRLGGTGKMVILPVDQALSMARHEVLRRILRVTIRAITFN